MSTMIELIPYSTSSALADGFVSCTGLTNISESPCLKTYSPLEVIIMILESLQLSVT